MKMKNQIFNIKRFLRYSAFNLKMNSRSYWMQLISIALVIFVLLVFAMFNPKSFHLDQWITTLVISGIISVILIVAGSFSYIRKKETQMQFYMQPASVFEKFIFEFLLRYVGFWIVFPLLFWIVGELAYGFIGVVKSMRGVGMEHIERVYCLIDAFPKNAYPEEAYTVKMLIDLLLMLTAFVFSGTCRFMKRALLKTIGFLVVLGVAIVYYFSFLLEVLELKMNHMGNSDLKVEMYLVTAVFTMLILAYGYFKLKEREV